MWLDKMSYIIYANMKSLTKEIDGCANNNLNFNLIIYWLLNDIWNKHIFYSAEDFIKIFCISLREYDINILNFEKNKMLLSTKEE